MKTIHKFPLTLLSQTSNVAVLQLPIGAKILDIQYQGQELCLWALVDTDKPTVPRQFEIVGTGWDLVHSQVAIDTDCFCHLKTVQSEHGAFIWHIFENILPF